MAKIDETLQSHHARYRPPEVGEVLYSRRTAKPYTVRNVSKSGQVTFSDPPWKSNSYTNPSPYQYTRDEANAIENAIEEYTGEIGRLQTTIAECEDQISSDQAAIADLLERRSRMKGQEANVR